MNTKIENWNGFEIRFIEVNNNEWQAVAKDVTSALGIKNSRDALTSLNKDQKGVGITYTLGGEQKVNTVSEIGIYKLVFKSRKKEAEDFQEWVYETIRKIRHSSGLEGFQIFRMLDKGHQREMMGKLNQSLDNPGQPDFIKANAIVNKAVSSKFGHPKMLKNEQMTPEMIVARQPILEDVVNLMAINDKFGLKLSISETIYSKYTH